VAQILRVTAFCVVLLVASIPIAMRVVCTTTMALGCRSIADEKAIVTRLSAVEDLAGMTILCSDKTGTLTLNEMRLQARDHPPLLSKACRQSLHGCVFSQGKGLLTSASMRRLSSHYLQKEMPMFCEGVSKRDVLVAAALATKWREPPKDALDTLVLNAIDLSPLDMYEQVEQIPFDTALKRTEATIRRKDGSVFRVRSGAESSRPLSPPPLQQTLHDTAPVTTGASSTAYQVTKGAPQVLLKMAYNTEDIRGMVDAKVRRRLRARRYATRVLQWRD